MHRLALPSPILVVVLALALVACSDEEGSQREEPGPSVEGSEQADPSAGGGADGAPSDGGEVAGDWRDVDLEDVPVEREVHPDELAEVMASCMREQGFPAEATRGGGVSYQGVSKEQGPLVDDAAAWCQARFPVEERYTRPLDDEQKRIIYRYKVEELIPCLEEQGYETPEPPSEDFYVANYAVSGAHWDPYPRPDGMPQEDWYDLNDTCPQNPPLDELHPEE